MINIEDRPEIRALIEQGEKQEEPEQQYVRAPDGNGHEAALKEGQ